MKSVGGKKKRRGKYETWRRHDRITVRQETKAKRSSFLLGHPSLSFNSPPCRQMSDEVRCPLPANSLLLVFAAKVASENDLYSCSRQTCKHVRLAVDRPPQGRGVIPNENFSGLVSWDSVPSQKWTRERERKSGGEEVSQSVRRWFQFVNEIKSVYGETEVVSFCRLSRKSRGVKGTSDGLILSLASWRG